MTVFEAIDNARKKELAIELRSVKSGFKPIVLRDDWSKGVLFITAYSFAIEYTTVLNKVKDGKLTPLLTSKILIKK